MSAAQEMAQDPAAFMASLSPAERAAVVAGRGLPRPRRWFLRPSAPSIVPGFAGVSFEAVAIFDVLQKVGGMLLSDIVRDVPMGSTRLHERSLEQLLAELEAFDLVERYDVPRPRRSLLAEILDWRSDQRAERLGLGAPSHGPAVRVAAAYELVVLTGSFQRWERSVPRTSSGLIGAVAS